MPPLPPNREFDILAARRTNASAFIPSILPMLRNSVPYNGRGPCMRCRWCLRVRLRSRRQEWLTEHCHPPVALNTGNCELRTECMAKEIVTDDRGRATGVVYFDESGRLQEQPADIVIISSAAIESARLLLIRSRLFSNGLGNRYDQVGRNLQGHHYTGAIGYFDFETYDDVGPGASIAVMDYNHGTPSLCGGGMLANEFIRLPIHMIDRLPPDTPRWGPAHKQAMRHWHKQSIVIMGPTQQIPSASGRVTIDPAVRLQMGNARCPLRRQRASAHIRDWR